jgi:hypothetical protein
MSTTEPQGEQRDPSDPSLLSVVDELAQQGDDGQFVAREGGQLLCLTCRNEFPAKGQQADRVRRLEGASDPADMVIVIPLECPVCHARGALTAHYGPEASAEEAEVLVAMERTPSEGASREGA